MTFIFPKMWTMQGDLQIDDWLEKEFRLLCRDRKRIPPVYVGDYSGIVSGHKSCGAQRKRESKEGFGHCSHFQQVDAELLFLKLPFP